MAKLLGIDVSAKVARAILVRTAYRKVFLEGIGEAPIETTEADAIRAAVAEIGAGSGPMSRTSFAPGLDASAKALARPDGVAVALPGDRCFYRRLELPRTAQRELASVLAFELESTVPFEIEGAVYDHRVLKKAPAPELFSLIAALARTEDVMDRVNVVREALGREPEVVGPGALPLANLVPLLADLDPAARAAARRPKKLLKGATPVVEEPGPAIGPVAIVDLTETRSEVVFLEHGEATFVRTISRGTAGLSPATAAALARELRQTVAAFRAAGGDAPVGVFLSGGGASVSGAEAYLMGELGIPVRRLPAPRLEGATPEQAERLPHFAKALGLALGLLSGSRSLNLRQGALEASRTYPFLREKVPLLSGLAAVVAVSFGFSVIAEMRSLKSEREHLDEKLALVTKEILGKETRDATEARETLEGGDGSEEEDPLPGVDGFDVMVQLSKSVPADVVHDVVEFDVARGHAVIHGAVPKETDAQKTAEIIAEGMRKHACMKDVKIQKVQQFGVDKQKYILELDLRCGERKTKKDDKKKKDDTAKTDGDGKKAAP